MSLTKRWMEQQGTDAATPDKHLQSAQRDVRFVLHKLAAIKNINEIDFDALTQTRKGSRVAALNHLILKIHPARLELATF